MKEWDDGNSLEELGKIYFGYDMAMELKQRSFTLLVSLVHSWIIFAVG